MPLNQRAAFEAVPAVAAAQRWSEVVDLNYVGRIYQKLEEASNS